MKTVIIALVFASLVEAQPDPGPSCLCFRELGQPDELYLTTSVTHANDGSGRVFVSELRGLVWIYREDGLRDQNPFLDVTGNIHIPSSEYGLMSFTFHPEFISNGLVYVSYSILIDGVPYQRLSEFTLSESNPDAVDPASERALMEIYFGMDTGLKQIGGKLLFGDDGYFYMTVGDGACCNDPPGHGQNKSTLHGTVLRIDVDTSTEELPYGIPPDNPFLGEPDTRPEIYAYGLRQPFTGSIDTGDANTGEGKGRIFIGDVGELSFEEIDLLESGGNYGWAAWEGPQCNQPELCDQIGPHIPPIISYNRSMGITVLLAGVYRGEDIPGLYGKLFFTDYGSTSMFEATEGSPGVWQVNVIPKCSSCPDGLTSEHQRLISTIRTDQAGEMYFSSCDSEIHDEPIAHLYKIVDPNNP